MKAYTVIWLGEQAASRGTPFVVLSIAKDTLSLIVHITDVQNNRVEPIISLLDEELSGGAAPIANLRLMSWTWEDLLDGGERVSQGKTWQAVWKVLSRFKGLKTLSRQYPRLYSNPVAIQEVKPALASLLEKEKLHFTNGVAPEIGWVLEDYP